MSRLSPSQCTPFSRAGSPAEPAGHWSEPSRDAFPPGTHLAEYEILSVIGEGRFGIVYLAMDHGLQRQVAIKEYLPAALASRGKGKLVALRSERYAGTFAQGLESFVDEARLLARFDHPSLVRVYRFWEANGTGYMVMPYYEGVTVGVARRAMVRPPDEPWLLELLSPLLGALEALHDAACYPREISPESILLLPDGRPLLLESGVAHRAGGGHTQALASILNPAFAPIEQYAESPELPQGPWSNLYALAAVAYYCISGSAPAGSTARALDDRMKPLSQVVDGLGLSFPELEYSVAFVSAIERALRVRPQERPQSVAEFRRALLGGRSGVDAVEAPDAIDEAAPPRTSSPLQSIGEDTEPLPVFPNVSGGKDLDDADDTALRPVPEDALRPDPDDFGAPPGLRGEANAGGGSRTLFMGVAAVALAALGAGGWLAWSDYRDRDVTPSTMTRSQEPERHAAPALPPQPPTETPAPAPSDAAAESPAPPPDAVEPATPAEPDSEHEATMTEAPTETPPPEPSAATDEAPSRAPPSEVVSNEPGNPRVLCGPRTHFALYRCMKEACERSKYYEHMECKYLRMTDEVRALP